MNGPVGPRRRAGGADPGHARRSAALREDRGATGEFSVIVALADAFVPEQFAQAEAGGVTEVMTMRWAYYHGMEATLEQKLDAMVRFADDVMNRV